MGQLDLFSNSYSNDLQLDLATYDRFGHSTQVSTKDGTPYFTNEFWTRRQRQSHSLHEISYRACFKAELPAFFIDRLTNLGDRVYDPFMGRGTAPLEAALRQRAAVGNDVNPLSLALLRPRLHCPTIEQIETRLDEIPWSSFGDFEREDLLAFYHPHTLGCIEGLRDYFLRKEAQGALDYVDDWIRMVCLNRLTGHSSGFFSVYTLPPNQAVTVERQKLLNLKRNLVPERRDVPKIVLRKSRSLMADGSLWWKHHSLLNQPSDNTPEIEAGSIDLVVTSPPFLDIVNYEGDNWLRCWFIGVDPTTVKISTHRTVAEWRTFVRSTLRELVRVVRPGGHIAFEVGEVRRGTVKLEQEVLKAGEGLPLATVGVLINQQEFTKTANCWGVNNNDAGTNTNRVVIFRREA